MLSDTIRTCDFMDEMFKNEFKDLDIELTQVDKTNEGLVVHFSYNFNNKRQKSSFIYNLNDDIIGCLNGCRVLEVLNSQKSNILRHKCTKNLTTSESLIVNEVILDNVNKLREIEFKLDTDSVMNLLLNKIEHKDFLSFVVKFSDGNAFTIERSSMFNSCYISSKTVIVVRRVLNDIIKRNGRDALYKNKDILSLNNIVNNLLSINIESLSKVLKDFDISISRDKTETVLKSTTSLLRIED